MSIPLDDFDAPLGRDAEPIRDETDFKRDRRGSPYVSDPAGATVKSGKRKGEVCWVRYGRPSSFGKDVENTKNLERWDERQIIKGLITSASFAHNEVADDELANMVSKASTLDLDSDDGRSALDSIIARAKALAKAGLAAERGTHMHAVTEDDDTEVDWLLRAERGEVLDVPVAVQAAMLEAWRLMLVAYELDVIAVEQKVVHDGWHLAGTLDRIVRLGRDVTFANGVTIPAGEKVLLDVKTGKLKRTPSGVIQYWHSYAIQCAAYADSRPYDVATEQRGAWTFDDDFDAPESAHQINQQWAIIAHLPVDEALAGKATCRLVLVDIAAARKVVKDVILPARQWQARTDLFALPHADEPCVEVPIERMREGEPEEPWHAALEAGDEEAFRRATEPNLIQQLEESVAIVEAAKVDRTVRHEFSATPIDLHRAPVTDEGDLISDEMLATLRSKIDELTPQAKAVLGALTKSSNEACVPFSVMAGATRRRWHIYRALLRLAAHYGDDLEDTFIRATLALVLPEAAQLGVALGPAIGSLTIDEAQRFVQAAMAVIATDAALHFDDDGAPTWRGVSLPAA